MAQISVSDLTFAYEGSYDNIFEGVSFTLDTDWKLGFVGRNGRGKTTFLHLLQGKYPYSGTISAPARFAYFPQPVADPGRRTLDLLQELCPDRMDWEFSRELSLLEVTEDAMWRPFATLSGGEQCKALLAALFLGPGDFMLIDEPTNHLDAAARDAVGRYLSRKKGFILVSHDRALLDRCVDHILSLNRTTIRIEQGNFSSWWQNKQRQDGFEQAENEKLRREIGRLGAAARRSGGWSSAAEQGKYGGDRDGNAVDRGYVGHKAAKLMKQAKNIERRRQAAVEEKSRLLHDVEETEPLKLSPLQYSQQRLVQAEELCLYYEGRQVCGPLSFTLNRGDRIALRGKNGSGKTSLLRLLCGQAVEHTGTLRLGSGLVVSYLPQDAGGLRGSFADFIRANGLDEVLFKTILRKLDFARGQFEKPLDALSAGQKKKVLLARSLCQRAHLYLWDEPLNYIDLFGRMQVEQLLAEYRPTLLFVEHDRSFADAVATGVVELG